LEIINLRSDLMTDFSKYVEVLNVFGVYRQAFAREFAKFTENAEESIINTAELCELDMALAGTRPINIEKLKPAFVTDFSGFYFIFNKLADNPEQQNIFFSKYADVAITTLQHVFTLMDIIPETGHKELLMKCKKILTETSDILSVLDKFPREKRLEIALIFVNKLSLEAASSVARKLMEKDKPELMKAVAQSKSLASSSQQLFAQTVDTKAEKTVGNEAGIKIAEESCSYSNRSGL